MFDVPITTIKQAKDFFIAMGCSSFHMFREYPERYNEFKKMNVPEKLKIEWRRESVDNQFTKLFEEKDYSNLWLIHSNMADLVEEVRTMDVLKNMLIATQHIRDKVPLKDRVIVAETINGRKSLECRSGLIYLSYDLKSPSLAKEFTDLSFHFAKYEVGQSQDFNRCQEATKTCNQIIVVIENNGYGL